MLQGQCTQTLYFWSSSKQQWVYWRKVLDPQDIIDCTTLPQLKSPPEVGGPVQKFPPLFFFLAGTLYFQALQIEIKMDRRATKKEQFLTRHINRSIALANYHTPINCIIWLHQYQLPLIHNLATIRACWITFNMPWRSWFVAFFAAGAVLSKKLACTHN